MEFPQSVTGVIAFFVGILYIVESILLVIFIIGNYNKIVSDDINIIPALLIMYAVPGALTFIVAFLEAISGAIGGKGI